MRVRIQPVQEPERVVAALNEQYRGRHCLVSLRHGPDKVAHAVMRFEKAYIDDDVPQSRTLRVVGHEPGSVEHASVALPLGEGFQAQLGAGDERSTLLRGDYQLTVVPVEHVDPHEVPGGVGDGRGA